MRTTTKPPSTHTHWPGQRTVQAAQKETISMFVLPYTTIFFRDAKVFLFPKKRKTKAKTRSLRIPTLLRTHTLLSPLFSARIKKIIYAQTDRPIERDSSFLPLGNVRTTTPLSLCAQIFREQKEIERSISLKEDVGI